LSRFRNSKKKSALDGEACASLVQPKTTPEQLPAFGLSVAPLAVSYGKAPSKTETIWTTRLKKEARQMKVFCEMSDP
jgi:hypothetical protein